MAEVAVKVGVFVFVPIWRGGQVTHWDTGHVAEIRDYRDSYPNSEVTYIVNSADGDQMYYLYSIQCGVCMGHTGVVCYQCRPS